MLILLLNQDLGLTTGSFAGTASAAFVGQARKDAVFTSAGVGALSATGNTIKPGVLASAGVGATSLVGSLIATAALSSAGVVSISFANDSTHFIGGDAIVRGTFSRGQWRDYKQEKRRRIEEEEQRIAAKKAREEREREQRRKAAKAAREAERDRIVAQSMQRDAMLQQQFLMNGAMGANQGLQSLQSSQLDATMMRSLAMQMQRQKMLEDEEREALELLGVA